MFHPSLRLVSRDEAGRVVVVPAEPAIDWQLLFCLLLVEVDKNNWKASLLRPGVARVSMRAMRGAYEALMARLDAAEPLRALAQELDALAFNFAASQ